MSQWMDLLRGPALGVVFMIFLLASVIIVTAFAALIAQMSLLLRLKPRNTSEKTPEGARSETGMRNTWQTSDEQRFAKRIPQYATAPVRRHSPQMVVYEPNTDEVVDAVWWQEVR